MLTKGIYNIALEETKSPSILNIELYLLASSDNSNSLFETIKSISIINKYKSSLYNFRCELDNLYILKNKLFDLEIGSVYTVYKVFDKNDNFYMAVNQFTFIYDEKSKFLNSRLRELLFNLKIRVNSHINDYFSEFQIKQGKLNYIQVSFY